MAFTPAVLEKFKRYLKPAVFIYPLIIIIAIPLLLAINTIWNLRSFNRDVNFVIRHQAVSTADTLKPSIIQNLEDQEALQMLLESAIDSNPDIVRATILETDGKDVSVLATTANPQEANEISEFALNQLAIALNEPFAGLSYDPNLSKNIWKVVIPITPDDPNPYLLSLDLKTDAVDAILARTSRDSFLILAILIVITLILLANHFVFYRRAQEAKQLAELDRLKDEFISMAAHELRAPITGLAGYLELLKEKIAPSNLPALESDLETLDLLTNDLRNLINDLLDVSRIEQGRLKVEAQDAQINDIISHVIKTLSPMAQQKGLSIKSIPSPLPVIKTDPDRLSQVFTNLISNSLKYTLKGGLEITAQTKNKFIEVTVRDTGIGIPADQLTQLFSKFHRVKDAKTAEVRGTGLGLWITKQIVEALGGKIYAQSIYGTGSSFTFTLPITH